MNDKCNISNGILFCDNLLPLESDRSWVHFWEYKTDCPVLKSDCTHSGSRVTISTVSGQGSSLLLRQKFSAGERNVKDLSRSEEPIYSARKADTREGRDEI